jgi:hypothetical protein
MKPVFETPYQASIFRKMEDIYAEAEGIGSYTQEMNARLNALHAENQKCCKDEEYSRAHYTDGPAKYF